MQGKSEAILRLRKDQLWRHARIAGVSNEAGLAKHLGISQSTVLRLLRGDTSPGERVIAAALTAFSDLRFDDLFEVVDGAGERSVA